MLYRQSMVQGNIHSLILAHYLATWLVMLSVYNGVNHFDNAGTKLAELKTIQILWLIVFKL